MIFENYTPTGILKNHIENYLVVKTQETISQTIIPETAPILSFRYKGKHDYFIGNVQNSLPAFAITGLRKFAKPILLSENTEIILIKFKPCEAALFFTPPQQDFFQTSVSLHDLCDGEDVLKLEDALLEDSSLNEKIESIENFLISLIKSNEVDLLIKTAVQQIFLSSGTTRIKELATSLNMSLDAFEKRFRKIIGTSPKQYSSIVRLTHAIRQKQSGQSIADIAYSFDYFDQSHFLKDFKLFTGKTPVDYFKLSPELKNQ